MMRCGICLERMVVAGPRSKKGKLLRCGHRFHEECVHTWLNYVCTCPECRQEIERGSEEWPIDIENINSPEAVTLEIHRQLLLLKVLKKKHKLDMRGKYWLRSVRIRHKREMEEWDIRVEHSIKTILVENFISDNEFKRYYNHFENNINGFFRRCKNLRDSRIVYDF